MDMKMFGNNVVTGCKHLPGFLTARLPIAVTAFSAPITVQERYFPLIEQQTPLTQRRDKPRAKRKWCNQSFGKAGSTTCRFGQR
jgi:hypothetical protein